VLQCVAVQISDRRSKKSHWGANASTLCCSTCVAVCCSVLQCRPQTEDRTKSLVRHGQHTLSHSITFYYNLLQCVSSSVLHHVTMRCSVLQCRPQAEDQKESLGRQGDPALSDASVRARVVQHVLSVSFWDSPFLRAWVLHVKFET